MSITKDRIATWRLILFALPATPHAFVVMPMLIILPSFYAAHTTVTLAQIAAVATFSRILDALADPIVGYLSDLTRTRLGPRKPWMFAVMVICSTSIFFLFQPPPDATLAYFTGWSFALYLGIAMFEIPRHAWAVELTRDYVERSRVSIFVAVANVGGSLVFWLLPLALSTLTGTTAITGTALTGIAWMYAVLMPLALLLTILLVPVGVPVIQAVGRSALQALLQSVRSCRPMWRYLSIITLWGVGQGAFGSAIYIFCMDYLKIGDKFPIIMIGFFVAELAAMSFWSRRLTRIDRHRAWAWSLGMVSLIRVGFLLVPSGESAFYPMLGLCLVMGVFSAPANFLPSAILGDVVDYDTLKTGSNKTGSFFAVNTLIIKITLAIGAGAALGLLAAMDYKVGKPNPEAAQWGLLWAFIGIPTLMHGTASWLAWRFPLTRKRHDIVRRRIERRPAPV